MTSAQDNEDVVKLFGADTTHVPAVPNAENRQQSASPQWAAPSSAWNGSPTQGQRSHSPTAAQSTVTAIGSPEYNTLDEPVWKTFQRDLLTIVGNLKMVLLPFWGRLGAQAPALRNWDLWGPLIFTLVLAVTLSTGAQQQEQAFSIVFAVVGVGAAVLTVNVILLGGRIVFFQAITLLGYCLFPLDVGAILCAFIQNKIVRLIIMALFVCWSASAAVPFIGGSVQQKRRALAVYPVMLLYFFLAWLILVLS